MDKIFNKPFAVNGARVAIPENGTENERVSFDKGFTQPYEVEAPSVDNPNGQGFNILRPEMNEILNQLSNACNVLAENIDKWTALTTENLNNITQKGRYFQHLNAQATSNNNYPQNLAGYLIVLNNGINSWGVTQIYKIWNSEKFYIRRTTNSTDWSAWDSLVLTSEYNTKITQLQNTDTNLSNNKEDKTKISTQDLTTENLNNITEQGYFRQAQNANATTERNYPIQQAGTLINLIPAGSGNTYLKQIYLPINNNLVFVRARSGSLVWTNWERLALKSEVDLKRNISDSYSKSEVYTKTQCDSTFLTKTLASSTYRTIADSYTKSKVYTKAEVNNRTPSLVLSKIGFAYNNIANASFTIPNNSFLKTCNIQIMFRIVQQNNNTITFNFKNGNSVVATRKFTRSSVSRQDYDVNDYISGLASFSITSDLLGKTITPEIIVTNTGASFLLNEVDLLITYGS